jgi:hypothetical protein
MLNTNRKTELNVIEKIKWALRTRLTERDTNKNRTISKKKWNVCLTHDALKTQTKTFTGVQLKPNTQQRDCYSVKAHTGLHILRSLTQMKIRRLAAFEGTEAMRRYTGLWGSIRTPLCVSGLNIRSRSGNKVWALCLCCLWIRSWARSNHLPLL